MDLTDIRTIKEIERKFDFGFSKGLGQNFLLDSAVLDEIADAAQITDGVLEIGPGFGVLTKRLSKSAQKVVSVEIDSRLIPVLDFTLADCDNVKIIEGDILKMDVKELIKREFGGKEISIAANLPYYITTPIITSIIEAKLPVKNIVVMVQKEVAERIAAKPASKDYGAITVLCNYYTNPRIVCTVPKESFYPAPKVDSAVLCMQVLKKPSVLVNDEKLFFKVVKSAFLHRRKTLVNCLSGDFGIEKSALSSMLQTLSIDALVRGERLGLSEFAKISDKLGEMR
ncbi:MAG: 16S rRNA (adenine(1518)-N(6)/adenine(1519)-N(6))-dimethyltransferase RsmA [Clostridia bacterium]|nr:16S rRNA (adenine(1518)-N(6)/adenine(1519)-N(6))-dimethyltransferase RsmA [Clostridia bacterium]